MKKEMLINVLQPEECRIAIVEDGVLEELYVERASQESYVGNIYKGRIVNIEPSIQAAFVDFGIGRNGFLHLSDVDPVYYKHLLSREAREAMEAEEEEKYGPRTSGRGGRRDDRREAPKDRGPAPAPRTIRIAEPEPELDSEPELEAEPIESPAGVTPSEPEDEFVGFDDEFDDAPPPPPKAETRPVPPPPVPRPERRPPPPPAVDDPEFGEFGAGLLGADESEEPEDRVEQFLPFPGTTHEAEPTESNDAVESQVIVESPEPAFEEFVPFIEVIEIDAAPDAVVADIEEEEKPAEEKKPKGRGRPKAKPKVEEPAAEPAATDDGETKAKPKPRRGRKKADADDDDDKPRLVPGAERRTTEGEETDIQPFFDAGDDFDVDAPNDRFAGKPAASEANDEEGFEEEEEGEESDAPAPVAAEPEEEEDFSPPVRRPEEDDRGRRGGGGRGGPPRGGPRGNDRGGPPRGGPRGNDRGGPPRGNDRGGRPPARDRGFPRPPIQEIFKRGQEVIVQVIKEGIGTKGPTLSTFVSIAGRYLVLMPSLDRVGVSRKIEDHEARRRLRDIMTDLNPPKGVGFIVRTAAVDRNEKELQNDLAYLLRLWQVMVRRIKKMAGPIEIYRESDMITRTIRDIFTNDIDTIWVDEANAFAHASEFLQIVMPRFADRIRYHSDTEPLFNKYRVEDEIVKINQKRIDLPQGGSIILEQTEALVAIDVNSGTFRADNNAEETAFRMNMLAAKEIARQLRLRDLGGVIVNDFIDMRDPEHRRRVENTLRDALTRDRARTKILRISQFGIIEMTRQRMQQSLKKRIYNDCPHCRATGSVKTSETMGIDVMRLLQMAAHRAPTVASVSLTVHADVAFYLLNRKRKDIAALEEKAKMEVTIVGQPVGSPELLEVKCLDNNGNEVRLFGAPPPRVFRGPPPREQDRRPRSLD